MNTDEYEKSFSKVIISYVTYFIVALTFIILVLILLVAIKGLLSLL